MIKGAFSRWLYRGKRGLYKESRPNLLARIMNRAWEAVSSWGLTPNYVVTLEVVGRRSGRVISLPLVMATFDGDRFLVSMLGEGVSWVRNVRAAGGNATLRHGQREQIRLEEVPVDQRPAVLKAYLRRAPGARPHVPVDRGAPLSEFEKIAADIPVFQILPRQ